MAIFQKKRNIYQRGVKFGCTFQISAQSDHFCARDGISKKINQYFWDSGCDLEFNNRNTPVFTCFLDLSKAFDLVEFVKLFRKLKNKLGKTFIRVLAFVYVFQMCCVDWAGLKSDPFRV